MKICKCCHRCSRVTAYIWAAVLYQCNDTSLESINYVITNYIPGITNKLMKIDKQIAYTWVKWIFPLENSGKLLYGIFGFRTKAKLPAVVHIIVIDTWRKKGENFPRLKCSEKHSECYLWRERCKQISRDGWVWVWVGWLPHLSVIFLPFRWIVKGFGFTIVFKLK